MDPSTEVTKGRHMRVLWAVKGLGPGGVEQLLVEMARGSSGDISYEVAYVVAAKSLLGPTLEDLGVRVHRLVEESDHGPLWVGRLAHLIRTGGYDVVHAHSPLLAGVIRIVARTVRRRPRLVYTEHNRWDRYRTPTRWLNRLTYRLDDATIAVSDGVRQTVAASLRDRVEVVYHGVDLAGVAAHAEARWRMRESLGVGPEDLVVGTVANLRWEKGYPDLLAAAKRVLEAQPTAIFVSAGQGPLEREIAALHRRLGVGDRFRLLGYRSDVLDVVAAFDVFTLASHHEGLPVAAMEAQVLGLPIVATAVGGLPEVVRNGREGRLVPPHRPDLLADALLEVLADPASRASMSAAARTASERFDVARALADVERRYSEVGRPTVAV